VIGTLKTRHIGLSLNDVNDVAPLEREVMVQTVSLTRESLPSALVTLRGKPSTLRNASISRAKRARS
jgi:hypothetical protein